MSRQGQLGHPLSAHQLRILGFIADGKTAVQIAAVLNASPATVRGHADRIYRQLGASSAANAVHLAHQRGLLGGQQHTS